MKKWDKLEIENEGRRIYITVDGITYTGRRMNKYYIMSNSSALSHYDISYILFPSAERDELQRIFNCKADCFFPETSDPLKFVRTYYVKFNKKYMEEF